MSVRIQNNTENNGRGDAAVVEPIGAVYTDEVRGGSGGWVFTYKHSIIADADPRNVILATTENELISELNSRRGIPAALNCVHKSYVYGGCDARGIEEKDNYGDRFEVYRVSDEVTASKDSNLSTVIAYAKAGNTVTMPSWELTSMLAISYDSRRYIIIDDEVMYDNQTCRFIADKVHVAKVRKSQARNKSKKRRVGKPPLNCITRPALIELYELCSGFINSRFSCLSGGYGPYQRYWLAPSGYKDHMIRYCDGVIKVICRLGLTTSLRKHKKYKNWLRWYAIGLGKLYLYTTARGLVEHLVRDCHYMRIKIHEETWKSLPDEWYTKYDRAH